MYSCIPTQTNELDQFFPKESINTLPTFMRCNMIRENFNAPILSRVNPFDVNINDKEACTEKIHPSGPAGNRQTGFGKNIDIDSELKRINHYADKCYYNNYKLDPLGRDAKMMNSPLLCHDKVFKINQTQSYKKSEQGSILDRNIEPRPCTTFQKFTSCKNTPMTARQLELYDFSQPDYCAQYPCQKLFNNVTKRSMFPNSYTPQDINKRTSTVDYTKLLSNDHKEIDQFYQEDLMCMPYSMTTEHNSHPNDCKSSPIKLRYY
jgi:hypothetical protein